jgi:hypothetical protein
MKRNIFLLGMLVMVLVFGMTVVGCATTKHGVEISNVSNVREIYIRNAGTTNWGANIASTIQDIDTSRFSERVDIRVLDTNGVVYSKYNVPFNDAAFVETGKTSSMNLFASLGLSSALLVIVLLIL